MLLLAVPLPALPVAEPQLDDAIQKILAARPVAHAQAETRSAAASISASEAKYWRMRRQKEINEFKELMGGRVSTTLLSEPKSIGSDPSPILAFTVLGRPQLRQSKQAVLILKRGGWVEKNPTDRRCEGCQREIAGLDTRSAQRRSCRLAGFGR